VAGVADRPHAQYVAQLLRDAAATSAATICISPHDRAEATRLLPIDPATIHVLPNGVDTDRFTPLATDTAEQARDRWRRWLVDDPSGWDSATREPGSIRYDEAVLDKFVDPGTGERSPVLLFVGRFLDFKRVPLLVRAYARARERFERPAPLVVWGGSPGEWEGEHPHDVAVELGVDDAYFLGWRGHDELPLGLGSSAALVAPSVDEPFGQVYLEAMACGVPVVGTTTGGPPSFVNVDPAAPDGWLVAPDDLDALADAMVALVNDPVERERRGAHALEHVRASYAWQSLARSFLDVYDTVLGD
jgi:glycosyltransferase involved in cell wall biosynthesis